MNLVDWVLIGAILVFAWAGWRQGFVAGLLSFTGFLAGGLAATFLVPPLIERFNLPDPLSVVALGALILVSAMAGQFLASRLGQRLRAGITWSPAKVVDRLGGITLNVLALALIVWIIASAVAFLPNNTVSAQIRQSKVLVGLDFLVPDQARNAFTGLRDLVGNSGVPRVFAGLTEVAGPEVDQPDSGVAASAAVTQARESIVQVSGAADQCDTNVSGSGFVFDDSYVLTNAHVVAGVPEPRVVVFRDEPSFVARIVYFDPDLDIAVLYVPDLDAPPLLFAARPAESRESAIVAGFPAGGGFKASSARIRAVVQARGEDIYGRAGVVREVYSFRGNVIPGNSGGPLLNVRGAVLGMVFASGLNNPDTGYALTADQLSEARDAALGLTTSVDNGSCRVRQ